MKLIRVFCCLCLLLVGLTGILAPGAALAQDDGYELSLTPYDGKYNATLTAGVTKYFFLVMENTGTAATTNISVIVDKPNGWEVTMADDFFESLLANADQDIDLVINTPADTSPGDYMINVKVAGDQASDEVEIRITVKSPVIEEKISMTAGYPTVEAVAGSDFIFELEFMYVGTEDSRTFELRPVLPKGWEGYMTPQYEKDKKISAITLTPALTYGNKIRFVATAPFYPLPEPGDYDITIEATSGDVVGTIDLTAVITAQYNLLMIPSNDLYNTKAKSGRENVFAMAIGNLGTAEITNIKFSSTKPEGWSVEFEPEKIDLLEAFDDQTVDVKIKPPADAISGDYEITVRASGTQSSTDEISIRVTVETPTIWGWVGVAIIVLVVAALVYIFMRFSRR